MGEPFSHTPPGRPATEGLTETLISAGLFLFVGFIMAPVGVSDSAVYNASVAALTWGARGVGIGLLIVAGLSWARVPGVLLLDAILAVVAAGGCLVIAVIWLFHRDLLNGVLLALLGSWNVAAARNACLRWRLYRNMASAARTPPTDE